MENVREVAREIGREHWEELEEGSGRYVWLIHIL